MPFDILVGDAREKLKEIPSNSVQSCITGPPYWNLRDYEEDNQIGLEDTPGEYINSLKEVFREVKRVLKEDGTLWLNLGDCYVGSGGFSPDSPCNRARALGDPSAWGKFNRVRRDVVRAKKSTGMRKIPGLKPKDQAGIPWKVLFSLQEEGWYFRSDIVWAKGIAGRAAIDSGWYGSVIPESAKDRPCRSHEPIFLLSKNPCYYFDIEGLRRCGLASPGGQPRTVWTISVASSGEGHPAVFPEALIEPMVLSSSRGGDLILDVFCGSGTTGVVSVRHGRAFKGIELNPRYVEMARRKIGGVSYDIFSCLLEENFL